MVKRIVLMFAALVAGIGLRAEMIVLECEQFENLGGWSLDSQFIDEMGSSYLLAHGLGKPVADAKTTFEVKKDGRYSVLQNYRCGACKFRKPTDNPNHKEK